MAPDYKYVWLLWSSAFLVPWALVYALAPAFRARMLRVSLATSLLGLTEPIFVPEYWNPPSLFDLAQRTGFDLESLIFCFAIGGLGALGYDALAGRALAPVPEHERHASRHRFHRLALAAPFVAFAPLYLLPWNPIYAGIAALFIGGLANVVCRPDLMRKTLLGGALFTGLYAIFMVLLIVAAPGYVERVWNLAALSGLGVGAIPLEELAFGFGFGMYWAGIYEHFAWHRQRRIS
ncbi:MAG TPA: lycopene cyclase domain-containing protein [Burkholderiales bacterium]|nr:lycopene cyclase domain-containing protein [Burkholderiales bacterium]